MNLFCVGLSHHIANVETRERFAGGTGADSTLRAAGCAEALVLITCNCVEVYGASEQRVSTDSMAECLAQPDQTGSALIERRHDEVPPFYRCEGAKCGQHMFRGESGLGSMVVGATEMLGQAPKAYQSP